LLSTPKKYTYVDTTENSKACPEQPDSKRHTDERHRCQSHDLPSTAADHVIPDEASYQRTA
jgi:hypothetical protein